jgi:drug/metabolite transporter (DMT)-like permease
VFFRERLNAAAVIGIIAAFTGAFVTVTNGNPAAAFRDGISTGDLFLFGCVLSWAAYTILGRHAMKRLSALSVLSYSSAAGVVLLTPIVFAGGYVTKVGPVTAPLVGAIIYLSFGAVGLAYLWYYQGVREVGATRAAVFLNVEPPAAILLGVVILGERLTWPVVVGAVLVMAGLYLVNRRPRDRLAGPRHLR